MLTPEKFIEQWTSLGGVLVPFEKEKVKNFPISDVDKSFLISSGLPRDAAPFLAFADQIIHPLEKVSKVWQLPYEFSRYVIIGSTGSGDPICIDLQNDGRIVYLDHGCDFKAILINSTIRQLAECLLCYRHLVEETIKINGEEAFLDGDIPEDIKQNTICKIKEIDKDSITEGTFWGIMFDI